MVIALSTRLGVIIFQIGCIKFEAKRAKRAFIDRCMIR